MKMVISRNFHFTTPHSYLVEVAHFNGSVFLEPGKRLFQPDRPWQKLMLFMGETARINYDLTRIGYYRSFNYDRGSEKILDMTPAQYIFCSNFESKTWKCFDSLAKTGSLSAKTYQVKKKKKKWICCTVMQETKWNITCTGTMLIATKINTTYTTNIAGKSRFDNCRLLRFSEHRLCK